MTSYILEINTSYGSVKVESFDFSYLQDVQKALELVHLNAEKAEKAERAQINELANKLFDAEVRAIKQPAKKRGRPAGSRNKK